jgi:prevent-host-death family protein
MSLREAKARLSEAVASSQGSYVLVTRHGKPEAVIVGVAGTDVLDVVKRFSLHRLKTRESARGSRT